MSAQEAWVPDPAQLAKLVQFVAAPVPTRYRVGPGDKNAGRSGTWLGNVCLRQAPGYEVILRMDDKDTVESFAPMRMLPILPGA